MSNVEVCQACERSGDLFPVQFKKVVKYNCAELEVTVQGYECCTCKEITYFPEDIRANEEAVREAKLDYDLDLESDV